MRIVTIIRQVLEEQEHKLRDRLSEAAERVDYAFISDKSSYWVNLCRLRSLMCVESNHEFVMQELARDHKCHEVLALILKAV